MYKVILFFAVFTLFTLNNAQEKKENSEVKFKNLKAPVITKENLIIPKYSTLLIQAKSKKKSDKKIHNYGCSTELNKCFVSESSKNNTERTSYEFLDNKMFLILKGLKDTQVYKRKAKNTGYTQEFSNYITSQINFYDNGNLHTIRHLGYGIKAAGYPIGTWYAYSKDGVLIQEIDHDKHFKMNFYDILEIADKYGSPYIGIDRAFNQAVSYWYIQLLPHPEDRNAKTRKILIDDKTGQIIYDIDEKDSHYIKDKEYDKLPLEESSKEWLRNSDKYQIPDNELYKLFRT